MLPYQGSFLDSSGTTYPYLRQTLVQLYNVRDYSYNLEEQPYPDEYPNIFRGFRGLLLDNRRHDVISCEEYDADPLVDDMSVISVWGTGEGLSFRGEWGVVTNRCRYGSFRGEPNENGEYPVVVRKNVLDFPNMVSGLQKDLLSFVHSQFN